MRTTLRHLNALRTPAGLRVALLFGACALIPLAIVATWAYRAVSADLTEAAVARLAQASQHFGLLVHERLRVAEALLIERAQQELWHAGGDPFDASFFESRLKLVSLSSDDADDREGPGKGDLPVPMVEAPGKPAFLFRGLTFAGEPSAPKVHITVKVRGADRTVTAVGELTDEYLWSTDAVALPEAVFCVRASEGVLLHCGGSGDATAAPDALEDRDTNAAQWNLYLKPRYGVGDWTISAVQPRGVSLASLQGFRTALGSTAALAFCAVIALSVARLRRTQRLLEVFLAATKRLSRGQPARRIRMPGTEYAGLARAFNLLSARMRRQLRLRTAFSEVDRAILRRHPTVEPVLSAVLPCVIDVLDCELAAVLVIHPESEGSQLTSARRGLERSCETERLRISEAGIEKLVVSGMVDAEVLRQSDLFRLSALSQTTCEAWYIEPIRVGRKLRGVLLLGLTGLERARRSTPRHATELAGRLAVALSNEERDRALIKQAYRDTLTGLPNRQLFRDRLERALVHCARRGVGGSVLFIDIDRFKNVNDSLGHSAGDRLLKAAAQRLQSLLRESDTLARIGGDEFTVICPELDSNAAGKLATRILQSLSLPEELMGMRCVVQASIGIACFPQDGATVEELIRNADTAMYRAKSGGGGNIVFFEERMNAAAVRRMRIEQRLREALDHERLTLHFQPKVGAGNRELLGAEALARWDDAEDGAQSPTEFIQIAEECGLIAQLGTWALDQACGTLRRWREQGYSIGHVAVNVSAHQLRDRDFPGIVRACLERHGLPGEALELEITESMVMHDVAQVADVLGRVKALGVQVAIDDFGTGYSSLAVLQRLPVDVLKIDRAFVTSGNENPEGAALFGTLVSIGRALGKVTVAEGIETSAQARFAYLHGCDVLQGYLFGRPMAAEEFALRWLMKPAATTTPVAAAAL